MNTMRTSSIGLIRLFTVLIIAGVFFAPLTRADEGGASFWLPGQMGSLVAAPAAPGWSLPVIYFHNSAEADGARELPIAGRLALGLEVDVDLGLFVPTYVFKDTVWGGQAAINMAVVYGRAKVSVDATLEDPDGNVISGHETDDKIGFGDLFPQFNVRWNNGVHNTMVYVMGGVPVGVYDANRLANIGSNHWALDAGGGYTYFNPDSGREFSAAGGLTYNFENPDTDYQNGLDLHIDWAASQFISESTHIGVAGYFFHQITGDSGKGAVLGDFESEVMGLGPQIGHMFMMGKAQAYFNLKAYWEFEAKHRPEGWNAWVTLSIPLGGG